MIFFRPINSLYLLLLIISKMDAYIDTIIETLRLIPSVDLVKVALASELFKNIFTENIRSYDHSIVRCTDDQLIFFMNARIINLSCSKINGNGFIYLKKSDIINLNSRYVTLTFDQNLRYFINATDMTFYGFTHPSLRFVKNSHTLRTQDIYNNSPNEILNYLKKIHDFFCSHWCDLHFNITKNRFTSQLP